MCVPFSPYHDYYYDRGTFDISRKYREINNESAAGSDKIFILILIVIRHSDEIDRIQMFVYLPTYEVLDR